MPDVEESDADSDLVELQMDGDGSSSAAEPSLQDHLLESFSGDALNELQQLGG